MSHQLKLTKFFKFTPQHSEDGQRPANLITSECQEASVSTTISSSSNLLATTVSQSPQELKSSTPECLHNTKKRTLNARSKISNKRTRITQSSKTSPLASTGRDPDCCPFWNKSAEALSKRLWSHIETGFVDSDWSSWNGSSRSMKSGSSFITRWKCPLTQPPNLPRTFWRSQTTSWRRTTENELARRG